MGLMPDCKEVHQLSSEALDRKLSLVERLRVRFHLAICEACANFSGQMRLIRHAMQKLRETDPPSGAGDPK